MKPWLPVDVEFWPDLRALIDQKWAGRSWPESAVVADLRYMVDQRIPLPGRRPLREKWRWTEHATRGILRRIPEWWDPTKGKVPTSRAELECRVAVTQRRADRPPASHRPPTGTPPGTSQTPQPTANLPPSAHEDPTEIHTRAVDSPSPTPSPIQPDPLPPANRAVGKEARIAWWSARASEHLVRGWRCGGDETLGELLAAYEGEHKAIIDELVDSAKGPPGVWPRRRAAGAPDQVLRREIRIALAIAARNWREPGPPVQLDGDAGEEDPLPTLRCPADLAERWDAALQQIRRVIGHQDCEIWFSPCVPQLMDGAIEILTPNAYYRDWIVENYLDDPTVQAAIRDAFAASRVVVVACEARNQAPVAQESP